MGGSSLVVRRGRADAVASAALSRAAFAHAKKGALAAPELWLVEATNAGVLCAALQPHAASDLVRASGGAEAAIGPGILHVMLAVPDPAALAGASPANLLNRLVRPLLKAVTKTGALAHYFGRDWISAAHRPVAMVAFAHDAATGGALFEAIVGVATSFATRERASYLDKVPATLAEVSAQTVSVDALADRVAQEYVEAYGRARTDDALPDVESATLAERPDFQEQREEAIGVVGAARDDAGNLFVGGDFMASEDALARFAAAAAPLRDQEALRALARAELGRPEVALFGVRSPESIADVVATLPQ